MQTRGRWWIVALGTLGIIMVILGVVSIAKTVDANNAAQSAERASRASEDASRAAERAVHALKTSSERTECRAQVSSEYNSAMWSDIALTIQAAYANQDDVAQAAIQRMVDRPPVQEQVEELCPAPYSTITPRGN